VPGVRVKPFVIAHRGSSHAVAEHTLAAYQQAIDEGADALECDVRLTRDGHLVCVHDRRIDRTSNGSGCVSEFDLVDLGNLDFASWKQKQKQNQQQNQQQDQQQNQEQNQPTSSDHTVKERAPVEERALSEEPVPVLTLERLLDAVLAAPCPVRLLIETKHPTRYAGLVEQQLVRLLRRLGLADPPDRGSSRVTVMSFSTLALRRIRLLAPRLPTVLLFDRTPVLRRDGTLPAGVGIAGPAIHLVRSRPSYVERVQARGHQVYVWTVNSQDDLDLVLSLGVAGIITDRPVDVLVGLGRR
jgi:glycerophosphoryl diester phosphodiesterase